MSPSRDMGCKCRRTGCQFTACIRGRKLSRETAGIRCLLTSSSLGCWRPGPLEFRLRGHVPPLSYGQLSAIVSPGIKIGFFFSPFSAHRWEGGPANNCQEATGLRRPLGLHMVQGEWPPCTCQMILYLCISHSPAPKPLSYS